MTVQEYITTYNILDVIVEQDSINKEYHYNDFHRIPQDILSATNFIASIDSNFKVHIRTTQIITTSTRKGERNNENRMDRI